MSTLDQRLATVVRLACLTEDRTPAEQRDLLDIATRVDKAVNRQTGPSNPHMPRHAPYREDGTGMPPCTYRPDGPHDKTCVCRGHGYAWAPVDGWSRLAAEAEQ